MNFSFLPQFWSYFNYGVLVTIMISVCVVFFGTILGVLVSLIKRSGIKPLEWLVSLYVWVFRGTPMVVQIMIAFNLIHMNLPTVQFGILNLDLSRIVPGIIVLSLNSGAYISESVRAGIESIPKGQVEAAYSLGIRPWNTMRYVVLPQAIKNILPALGNEFVNHRRYGIVEWCTDCCDNNLLDLDTASVRSLLLFDCDNGYDSAFETNGKTTWGGT